MRLESEPVAGFYVAVAGVEAPDNTVTLESLGVITANPVPEPPGVIHIVRAAKLNRLDYLAVARCSQYVRGQISFDLPPQLDRQWLDLSWHYLALLKLRGNINLRCPAVATKSWNVISAFSDNSVGFRLLDEFMGISLMHSSKAITQDDLQWAANNYKTALELRNHEHSRRFGLAFNVYYTWNHSPDPRACFGNLWVGLEALFGDRADARRAKGDPRAYSDKLADRIGAWLGEANGSRIRELYDRRCDALHGRWMEKSEMSSSLVATEELLRRSLVQTIEKGQPTLPDWS